ncbi:MAG: C10 family peptidase, partial [Bacteroidaceae bacterium]|nr:C10 family peptidase [Bacteroidaceae bacterium]
PILGYSTSGRFDATAMPPHVQHWMETYAQQIEALDAYALQAELVSDERPAITPMLTTLWNQGSPYNDACPLQGSARTYTGCTATALAQVMKYHEWPAEQTTAIPAYTTPSAKIYVPELAPTTFRWSEMQDDYHYSDYATAVAELMRYCGQALYSDYTASSTSAAMTDIPQALYNYFGYDAGVRHLYQADYPLSEWEEIIYAELQAGRPVIHAGTSLDAGHAFVCDGYDGAGMFHFNWGWGGMYDGYFKLSLLTPGVGGIGSGSADGYSANQRIVIGIQPPTGVTAPLKPFSALNLQQSGTNLYCDFQNPNTTSATAHVGFALLDATGNIERLLKDCGTMTLKGYNLERNWVGLYMGPYGEVDLAPGVHRIAAVSKVQAEDDWQHAGTKQTYFEVEIGEGRELLSAVIHPVQQMEIASFECISSAVVGTNLTVRVTVNNQGDDLNSMLYFYVSETDRMGTPVTRIPLLLHGNTTSHYDVSFFPRNVGRYNMWLSNVDDGVSYIEKREIDVIAAPTQPAELELLSCTINPHDVSAEIEVRNNGTEPYYREIVAHIYEDLYGDGLYYYLKKVEQYGEIPPHATRTYTFTFDGVTESRNCYIYIGYYKNHTDEFSTQLGPSQYFTTDVTSLPKVPVSVSGKGMTFRLDGTKVTRPQQPGIYIIDGQKRWVR